MPVWASPEQITRIVPSPPAPSTRSTFSRTACCGHRASGILAGGFQPERPIPASNLQLVFHVPPERDPVGDLGRVEDDRGAPQRSHRRLLGDSAAPDDLTDQFMRNRHLDPGDKQRDRCRERAVQRAAHDVGDVVRAGDPAIEGDGEDQQAGADLPEDSRAERSAWSQRRSLQRRSTTP